MKITVDEFLDLFIGRGLQEIKIYDCNKQKYIYRGVAENIPNNLLNCIVDSLNNTVDEFITINIYSK